MPQYGQILELFYFYTLYKVPHILYVLLITFYIFYLLKTANIYLLTDILMSLGLSPYSYLHHNAKMYTGVGGP